MKSQTYSPNAGAFPLVITVVLSCPRLSGFVSQKKIGDSDSTRHLGILKGIARVNTHEVLHLINTVFNAIFNKRGNTGNDLYDGGWPKDKDCLRLTCGFPACPHG